ncbi:MAG: ABC transporter permease [Lachnospiraceae bacterium]|nr:ABC transporter permease [Lachnospiraceae bacterium]
MKKLITSLGSRLNKKRYILLFVNVLMVLAFIFITCISGKGVSSLYSQQAAQRWDKDKENYAQVSVFASPEKNLQKEDIETIRNSIMSELAKESFEQRKSGARLWIDAYSGECETQVRKDWTTLTVTAVGVGNDFFLFHTMDFLSGSGLTPEDENTNRVVLDENLAWALFGSNDIAGMQVWMDDEIFTVAGVVAVEEDELSQLAYGSKNRMYLFYDKLKQHEDKVKITCYEAVMPNPITNYAYYTLRTACGLDDESDEGMQADNEENPLNFDSMEVIENSNRFEPVALFSKRKNMKLDSMRTNSVSYPYWENIARVIEKQQYGFLVVRIWLLIVPVLSVIGLLYYYWKNRSWTLRGIIVGKISQMIENRREERARQLDEQKKAAEDMEEQESEEDGGQEDVKHCEGEETDDEDWIEAATDVGDYEETDVIDCKDGETDDEDWIEVAVNVGETESYTEAGEEKNQEKSKPGLRSVTSEDIFNI